MSCRRNISIKNLDYSKIVFIFPHNVFKDCLGNMVKILIMSPKMAMLGLLKINFYHMTEIIF